MLQSFCNDHKAAADISLRVQPIRELHSPSWDICSW